MANAVFSSSRIKNKLRNILSWWHQPRTSEALSWVVFTCKIYGFMWSSGCLTLLCYTCYLSFASSTGKIVIKSILVFPPMRNSLLNRNLCTRSSRGMITGRYAEKSNVVSADKTFYSPAEKFNDCLNDTYESVSLKPIWALADKTLYYLSARLKSER